MLTPCLVYAQVCGGNFLVWPWSSGKSSVKEMRQVLGCGSSENQILLQQRKLLNKNNRKAAFCLLVGLLVEFLCIQTHFKTTNDEKSPRSVTPIRGVLNHYIAQWSRCIMLFCHLCSGHRLLSSAIKHQWLGDVIIHYSCWSTLIL